MTVVRGRRLPDTSAASIGAAVGELLDDSLGGTDGPVLVLVDGPYPYHPSTGYVTNPATLRAVVDHIDGRDVTIAVAGTEQLDPCRTARYLGYERVADETGAGLVALHEDDDVTRTVEVDGESTSVSVPLSLLDRTVVAVPTVRRSRDLGVEAGAWTLARALWERPTAARLRAAPDTCEPAVTVVDGSYVFGDPPVKARFLLTGDDVRATTAALASLFSLDGSAVPHVDRGDAASVSVEGFDADAVETLLAGTSPGSNGGGGDGLLSVGYGLYAKLTGDLVPPQMLEVS